MLELMRRLPHEYHIPPGWELQSDSEVDAPFTAVNAIYRPCDGYELIVELMRRLPQECQIPPACTSLVSLAVTVLRELQVMGNTYLCNFKPLCVGWPKRQVPDAAL